MTTTADAGAQPVDRPAGRILARVWPALSELAARYGELALVLALTGVSAYMRLWHLTTLPYGFHNDEGNVTLDAKRILDEGWIGSYSLLALGYPIAVNYFVAPFIKIFGLSVFAVRFPMALLGIAAIPLCYGVIRNAAGWRAAACGTVLFSVSIWHLHLSRVGFPVIGWPVVEFGSLLALQLGIKTRWWPYFVVAGLLIGVGLWVYNSVFLFAGAVAIYLAVRTAVRLVRRRDVIAVKELMLMFILLGTTLLGAWPIIEYARDPKNNYEGHFRSVYVFDSVRHDACVKVPEKQRDQHCRYAAATTRSEKADVIRDKSKKLYNILTTELHQDGADGLGAKPPVGKMMMYLAIVGAGIALLRFRNLALGIGLLSVPLIAIGAIITLDGQFRRTFGLMPVIAMFGGLTLGLVWEWADRQRLVLRLGALALIAAVLGGIAWDHMEWYYRDYNKTGTARFVFYPEMRQAAEYIDTLGHPYVIWYSGRSTLGHESRRVLASHIAGGEERSKEFGGPNAVRFDLKPNPTPSFPARRQPDGLVFVFMDGYATELDEVTSRYPGGTVTELYDDRYRVWNFRAYYLPADLLDYYSRRESVTIPVRPGP